MKLKAFTLIELLIGLIIGALVISFSYTAYEITYKQFNIYRKMKENSNTLIQLYTVLQHDFDNSTNYILNNDEITFIQNSNTKTKYLLGNNITTRIYNETIDTFNMSLNHVFKNTIIPNDTETPFYDFLLFETQLNNEKEIIILDKHNSACEKLTLQIHNAQ